MIRFMTHLSVRRENRKLMRRLNNNTGGNNTVNTNGSVSPHTNGNDVPRLDTIDDSSTDHNGAQSMALVKAEKRAQSDDEADDSIDHGPLHNGIDKGTCLHRRDRELSAARSGSGKKRKERERERGYSIDFPSYYTNSPTQLDRIGG